MNIKNKTSLFTFIGCFLFLLLVRLPSFFGPQFSSDEGFYLSVGHSLAHGELLYRDIWDNKPPLLYIFFGLNSLLFGNSIAFLRIIGFLFACADIILIYFIGKDILNFSDKQSRIALILSTVIYSFYFEFTLFNAENIFVPLVLSGFWLFYKAFNSSQSLKSTIPVSSPFALFFFSGLSFAFATWTKLNCVPEIIILLLSVIIMDYRSKVISETSNLFLPNTILAHVKSKFAYLVVFVLPIILLWGGTSAFFAMYNSFSEFHEGIVGFSSSYLDYHPITPRVLGFPITFISALQINIIIFALFYILIVFLYLKTRVLKHEDSIVFLIASWFAIDVFCIFLSSRGYPHYFQQIIPPLLLFAVVIYSYLPKIETFKARLSLIVVPILLLNFILNSFTNGSGIYNWFGLGTYYGGAIKYSFGQQTYPQWNSSFDESGWSYRTSLVNYVNITKNSQRVYFVGSSPELYSLTNTYPGYRMIVDYHISPEKVPDVMTQLVKNNTTDIYISDSSGLAIQFNDELKVRGFMYGDSTKIGNTTISHYRAAY